MARPSSYTPEIGEEICEQLANGVGIIKILNQPGMPHYSTFRRWEDDYPEFRALSTRSRQIGVDYIFDQCIEIADEVDDPKNKRVRIDTRLRIAGKLNQSKYGERIAHTGSDGGSIKVDATLVTKDVRDMTPEERADVMREFLGQ